ncbi:MAG: GTPase-associated system all-helical protein GASH [Panacagrimonas sp.]
MADVARHIRIVHPEPSDDLVQKRTSAVAELQKSWNKKRGVLDLVLLVDGAVAGLFAHAISDSFAAEVEAAIQKSSASFVRENNDRDIAVCASLAVLMLLESAKPGESYLSTIEVIALATWSALSFQAVPTDPKVAALVSELSAKSQRIVQRAAEVARSRKAAVPLAFEHQEADTIKSATERLFASAKALTEILSDNAVLDREETDVLWWALRGRSDILKRGLSDLHPSTAAVMSGFELSQILRRVPADAHKHLATRLINAKDKYDTAELMTGMGEFRSVLGSELSQHAKLVNNAAFVLPLLTGIGSNQLASFHQTKRDLDDWAGRALLEGTILRVYLTPRPTV